MAAGAFTHGAVFALLPGELAVTVAAELVKGRFRRLGQIRTGSPVTVETATGARFVDEVVVAGDATHASVILVREIRAQRRGHRRRLQQVQATNGSRQQQERREGDAEQHDEVSPRFARQLVGFGRDEIEG